MNNEYEVLFGRPLDWVGGHTAGQNRTHLGFLFVGNYDLAPPPDEMLRVACARALRPWLKAFNLTPDRLVPHRDYADKSCPGLMFSVRRLVAVLNALPEADL